MKNKEENNDVTRLDNLSLARQFAFNYAVCNPNDDERDELERRGLNHITLQSACAYLKESCVEKMDEAEFDAAIEDAATELAEALDNVKQTK